MNITLIMDPVHLNKLFSKSNWWFLIPCYYQNSIGDIVKHPLFQHCYARYSGKKNKKCLGIKIYSWHERNESKSTRIKYGSVITLETLSPTQEWALLHFLQLLNLWSFLERAQEKRRPSSSLIEKIFFFWMISPISISIGFARLCHHLSFYPVTLRGWLQAHGWTDK